MDLKNYRDEIDKIDAEILELFLKRMNTVSKIAEYKKGQSMMVSNKCREREILQRVTENAGEEMEDYVKILFSTLFDLSRSYQSKLNSSKNGELSGRIIKALEETPNQFPKKGIVACQGIEGAYSQLACDKMFTSANIMYFKTFDGVFNAVQSGLCRYGILPIENCIHGTVNEVYDLMQNYKFSIIRAMKLKINHAVLAKKGTKLSEIKEIYSHEQAIGQCSEFLKKYPNIKINICENTAVAAKLVSESNRDDIASISSPDCASYYGLEVLDDKIANDGSNFTRFICITKDMQIYPGSNKISLMLTLNHTPGALYEAIAKFAALGLNLTKLESRPIVGKDFEFLFYFDLDASVYSKDVLNILDEFNETSEKFTFLGSYTEG